MYGTRPREKMPKHSRRSGPRDKVVRVLDKEPAKRGPEHDEHRRGRAPDDDDRRNPVEKSSRTRGYRRSAACRSSGAGQAVITDTPMIALRKLEQLPGMLYVEERV